MIPEIQKSYSKTLTPPQLKDNGDFAGNTYLDTCQGGAQWGHLRVEFLVGTVDAAIGSTAETTAPLLESCDTTDGTYAAITGAALSAVIAAGDDDKIYAIDVDLADNMCGRYVRVQAPHAGDGTTGCNLAILGILTKPQGVIDTAAKQGLAANIQI